MALIYCPECAEQVSSAAPSCPKCGFPIAGNRKAGFREAAAAAGVDLSPFETTPSLPRKSAAQIALLLSQKKRTNHILHLLLSIVTGGVWLIGWLLVANNNSRHNRRIDEQIQGG